MKKFLFVTNIIFSVLSIIFAIVLLYLMFTEGFTVISFTALLADIFMGLRSVVDLIGGEK